MSSSEEKNCQCCERRDFLELTAGAMGAVAVGSALWPLIDSMNPSADMEGSATIDVDISGIKPGSGATVIWQKKPVFIRRRTKAEIAKALEGDSVALRDPEKDNERVKNPEWLVVIGVCTHLGCIPTGHNGGLKGDYDGWFCPCHGAHYDLSGRVRSGPAPKNLKVPKYEFVSDMVIRIG